ncbi:hypothetical protein RSOL_466400 [Rhizoctonia solani AG-3 Rhs1AP]|uniref:Uncharacterized protein n=1 Tax=Rhizoctonia solani AG-3 Rhs1AP TaxID=1086054 RepID=X8JI83_9AGAM|nr:hypothetical protein RSOL_466400 [Rhizoctonia solani AG-3 Rhs1AP]
MTLPVQLAAPVLTGSITWIPGHYAPKPLSNSVIATSQVQEGVNISWSSPTEAFSLRRDIGWLAAGLVYLAWGRETKTAASRRYIPKLRLEINSTLTNVTLPYFSVDALEWVRDPKYTLSAEQLDIEHTICPRIARADPNVGSTCRPVLTGAAFLIPDTPWPNQTDWRPSSSVVSEKRLMLKTNDCEFYDGTTLNLGPEKNIELDRAIYVSPYNRACYVFAWVTYTAGASTCYNCPVLSYGTVQSTTDLPVKHDILTEVSLRFMPDIAELMEDMETIDMTPTWESTEANVVGTLTRSYAASWMALIEALGGSTPPHNTTYSISAPASRASVNTLRVYIWLGLQSLVTLSGALFLCVQSQSSTPIIVDTTLAAFYLDTSAVSNHNAEQGVRTARRVEFENDRLRLKE